MGTTFTKLRNRAGIVAIAIAQIVLGGSAAGAQDYDQQVRAIAETPAIQQAMKHIEALEQTETEALLIELTEIPAPPFKEEKRAARYKELLEQAGLSKVSIDDVGNVLALRRGSVPEDGRTVAIVAHLDTVFPEGTDVTVKRDGARLIAPGIGDDTRGLVLVHTVVRAMEHAQVSTRDNVLFVASVGEEGLGDLRGVKHLLRDGGPRVDAFIAVDGGSADRILNHAVGSYRYRVHFRGPGGHSWGAFGLANPAHAMSRAVYYFDQEASEFVISGPKTSYNIGRIGGGTSVNAIPFENWMEVDMRSVDPKRLDEIDAILHRSVQKALEEQNELRQKGEPLTVELDKIGDRPSGIVDSNSPLIQRAMAVTRFLGVEPTLGTGSTDSNYPISLGIPSTTIGRGGEGEGAHSLDEWWSAEGAYLGTQKTLLLIAMEAGLASE